MSLSIKTQEKDKLHPQAPAEQVCAHCGEAAGKHPVIAGGHAFCCDGCRIVFELLHEGPENLTCDLPDLSQKKIDLDRASGKFAFLDLPDVQEQLLDFREGDTCTVTFFIPSIHCSSCIWVLEHLYKFREGISQSRVHFLRKELYVVFDRQKISLRELVSLLTALGYEPRLQLSDLEKPKSSVTDRSLYLKLGVAGFAFGNIMLLALPEYLAFESFLSSPFRSFFGYLSILLSLPVLLYSSTEYFSSALAGLRHRIINIDVPISIGILVLFFRSVFEIVTGAGPGYLDSFAGLLFFLLIGKVFQKKTYDALSFDRDFRSYFPISVLRIEKDGERPVALPELRVGDRIRIRNEELVPADASLLSPEAWIDYSFVTGESRLVKKQKGEILFAGGRIKGQAVELQVIKEVSQSYLTRMWNRNLFREQKKSRLAGLSDTVAKYFTAVVLVLAAGSFFYWLPQSHTMAWNAFTAVLIVACPCALALSIPFALGNALRILGKTGFFVKNTETLETMARVNALVFDKTGTLTEQGSAPVVFHPLHGGELTGEEKRWIRRLAGQSTHPLSQQICQTLGGPDSEPLQSYREIPGKGIEGRVAGRRIRLGSATWILNGARPPGDESDEGSRVFVAIDREVRGYFTIRPKYRPGLLEVVKPLQNRYWVAVLSGDQDFERPLLEKALGARVHMRFQQSPEAKLEFIQQLQKDNKTVMMLGDGLNDAGALRQSDVGVAVTENTAAFTPACDAILTAEKLPLLPRLLRYSHSSIRVVLISFAISFLYNLIGLSFAVSGQLSPVIAAILMPLSSITVVAFATLATQFTAKRLGVESQ